MIYRILIDDFDHGTRWLFAVAGMDPAKTVLADLPAAFQEIAIRRMRGVNSFGAVMFGRGLRSPRLASRRARFYFTEAGWRHVGRAVAAEARRAGHVVRVLRSKEPARSRVVYRDALQVAVLPRTRGSEPPPVPSSR